jgi:hypothetical protein
MGRALLYVVLVACCAAVGAQAGPTRAELEKQLVAEAHRLERLSADPILVRAVRLQNASGLTREQIAAIDEAWIEGGAESRVKAILENLCSQRLRGVHSAEPAYKEILVADARGANVCMSQRSTDFFQGDEAKWKKSFNGGAGQISIQLPDSNPSVRGLLAHISLPIRVGGETIGVVIVAVDPRQLPPRG